MRRLTRSFNTDQDPGLGLPFRTLITIVLCVSHKPTETMCKHLAKIVTPLIVLMISSACAQERQTASTGSDVVVTEWPVPWERTRPRDPYVAPDGRVWFCGQTGGYLGVLDPESGEFARYELGEGASPHNLIVDNDGFVWYAGNRRAHIGRLDPETGDIKKYDMPDKDAVDPHTLVFDSDGNIWFTLQGSNMIGHLNTSSGEVRLVTAPTARSRPYGIWLDSSERPWVALFGTNKLAVVDPVTMELTEIDLERERIRPRRLVVTSDDNVWFVDYVGGYMGRYEPDTGFITEFAMPGGDSARPYGMIVDEKDRIWFVETGVSPNRFVGFDTATGSFLGGTDIPSGGGSVRHMYYDASTRSVWFGTDTNHIGRAVLPG